MTYTGANLIAGEWVAGGGRPFQAIDPSTGEALEPVYGSADNSDVARACSAAEHAFGPYAAAPLALRALFLERCAVEIEELGDTLCLRAALESGLPLARMQNERNRTCAQLRLFAAEVRDGGWQRVRIDLALADRLPMPRPDIRQRWAPLGPVAVFGASNFPLAFSVAGGDTASALAAGCPVVIKGHPAHPGTGELVGGALLKAVIASDLPRGVVSLLNGGHDLGATLVQDPRIRAVGFTGSRAGGRALMKLAAERPFAIPVYAEMSSVNPVLLLPDALNTRAISIAEAFIGSLTLGAGQFCTNPGLVFAIDGPDLSRFVDAAARALAAIPSATMLTADIYEAYVRAVTALESCEHVTECGRGREDDGHAKTSGRLFETTADAFLGNHRLSDEVFGACGLIVRCRDVQTMLDLVDGLEGQLTTTLHFEDGDHDLVKKLMPGLERCCGRIVANGWPTGVEVSHAMVHGGPFPASSDGRSSSVGTLAIDRFLRPICYQDFPQTYLPEALLDANPLGLPRRLDG